MLKELMEERKKAKHEEKIRLKEEKLAALKQVTM